MAHHHPVHHGARDCQGTGVGWEPARTQGLHLEGGDATQQQLITACWPEGSAQAPGARALRSMCARANRPKEQRRTQLEGVQHGLLWLGGADWQEAI